jgi:hypothetical protein
MNEVPIFVNALLCVKAILRNSNSTVIEVPVFLPKGGKKCSAHIHHLKIILSDYVSQDGIKVDSGGKFLIIDKSKLNRKTPSQFFDGSYYPTI